MDEKLIGINNYSSKSDGFNGKIKYDPESFIVNEIPLNIKRNDNGKYSILKIRLYNWDTNKFLIYLADELKISKKRITYAGTKDKTGITTQYFCVNLSEKYDIKSLNIRDAELIESFRSNDMIRLGDLKGNEFIIKILSDENNNDKILNIYNEINNNGGFPNFYGYQRFGNIRINTHKIGKLILKNRYEDAVKLYLYDPEYDHEDYRINFNETEDAKKALNEFPKYLSFERSLLGYISENNTYKNAFSVFPKNLTMLFIHAYQSYLFNRILSERMESMDNLYEVLEGDLLYSIDDYFNPDKREIIHANKYNLEKLNKISKENKIRTAIPLIGYKTELSSGIEGEIEKKILNEENININDFNIKNNKDLSSSGDYRIISVVPYNFKIIDENKINFILGKGIYATSFVREFLKNGLI